MAGKIFIEAHDVTALGLPTGAQHLYLVHVDDGGAEHVLRAGSSRTLPIGAEMAVEINVPIDASKDARGDDSPQDRHSTELACALGIDAAWALMVKYAKNISAADYPYVLLEENSNAFVGALLTAAGGNPGEMLPHGIGQTQAVGFAHADEILDDLPPPKDGTVRGTADSDIIAGIQVDEVILARGGADRVHAGGGDDTVQGGAGNDRLWGEAGADLLRGGGGADVLRAGTPGASARRADRLLGEAGDDTLLGSASRDVIGGGDGGDQLLGGAGDDVLAGNAGADLLHGGLGSNRFTGGAGADVFRFRTTAPSDDRVTDFQDDTDSIRIDAADPMSFDDLDIVDTVAGARISFAESTLLLNDVAAATLDAADFEFWAAGVPIG